MKLHEMSCSKCGAPIDSPSLRGRYFQYLCQVCRYKGAREQHLLHPHHYSKKELLRRRAWNRSPHAVAYRKWYESLPEVKARRAPLKYMPSYYLSKVFNKCWKEVKEDEKWK